MGNILPTAQITRQNDSIFADKGNGTKVNYRIFPEFELHTNTIDPGTEQEWHHHTKIEEVLYVESGELTVLWVENGNHHAETLLAGDIIRVGATVHTCANRSNELIKFIVFRFVPDGYDKREIIKNDRFKDDIKEAVA